MQHSDQVTTLKEAYFAFIQYFPKKAANLKISLLHYLLPYQGFNFDFSVRVGEQFSREKERLAWELAHRIKLEDLGEIQRVLSWQQEVFDTLNAKPGVRRPNKHYLKHLLTWCQEQGYLRPKPKENWEVPQSLPGYSKAFHRRGRKEGYHIVDRQALIDYGADFNLLSDQTKRELSAYKSFWTDISYDGLRPIPKPIELSTYNRTIDGLLYLVGWHTLDKLDYHRRMCERAKVKKAKQSDYESGWLLVSPEPPEWLHAMQERYPPHPVETFVLDALIPIVDIRPSQLVLSEPFQAEDGDNSQLLQQIQAELKAQNASLSFETVAQLLQSLQQGQKFSEEVYRLNRIIDRESSEENAQALMQEACKHVRGILKHFYKWLQYHHNPTESPDGYRITPTYRAGFCNILISLTKFRYREVTNPRRARDYLDIDLVVELKNIRQEELKAPHKPNTIHPVKRDPTWDELGRLLKELLVACAPRRKVGCKPGYSNMGPMRTQTAVAADVQKYLVMMFFRLVSPDRQHVVRELKVHDTLKLCWINWETRSYEEAPWDYRSKRYKAYYDASTRLYYLEEESRGGYADKPTSKPFAWVIFLDASQTKIDQENAYRVPKIYNPELHAWLYGREDFSGAWFNWPPAQGKHTKWTKTQYNWCGFVDLESERKLGFRDAFAPTHDFVFTQPNGKPFTISNMSRFYDAILWRFLGIRSNPHAVRSSATGHFKRLGMTDAESAALARLKSHSTRMQDSPSYNKLSALEKTAKASEMIVNEFLQKQGLDPEEYGLV